MLRSTQLLFALFVAVLFVCALPIAAADNPQNGAAVTFTLDFPNSEPEHYSIRIPSEGPSHYQSSRRLSSDSDATDDFDFNFTISPETRHKIFVLTEKSGYFQKDLDSHHKNLAFTGKKTLAYEGAGRTGQSTFNFSSNSATQELTGLFQNLSATLEFGHRLDYDRRYQKLALNEELKRMEEMAQANTLIEMTAIQPILEQIIADQSVVNVARARAQRLLAPASSH